MIALVTFFLIALIVSSTAVWLYRFTSNWKGFNQITAGNSGKTTKGWLKAQQSFSSLASSTRGNAKYITLPNSKGGIKAPWGW
jgi:hypothetical protein